MSLSTLTKWQIAGCLFCAVGLGLDVSRYLSSAEGAAQITRVDKWVSDLAPAPDFVELPAPDRAEWNRVEAARVARAADPIAAEYDDCVSSLKGPDYNGTYTLADCNEWTRDKKREQAEWAKLSQDLPDYQSAMTAYLQNVLPGLMMCTLAFVSFSAIWRVMSKAFRS